MKALMVIAFAIAAAAALSVVRLSSGCCDGDCDCGACGWWPFDDED